MNQIFSGGLSAAAVYACVGFGRPIENNVSKSVNSTSGIDRSCQIVSDIVATVSHLIGFKLDCLVAGIVVCDLPLLSEG